jgi:hypothetical protein
MLHWVENRWMEFSRSTGAMGGSTMVYELRIYHVIPGKMENLVARLRDHTMKLFADYGIKSVAYWTALDERVKSSTSLHSGASERGSGGSELEGLPGRSGVEERATFTYALTKTTSSPSTATH